MGAWGAKPFENDDALDWAWSLEDDRDASVVRAALDAVASAPRSAYVDADAAACAVAAAAVVAKAVGAADEELPDEAESWLAAHRAAVDPDLVASARAAVARVRSSSELRELWDDADPEEWLDVLDRLDAQLRAA